jgi:hypothetical protein
MLSYIECPQMGRADSGTGQVGLFQVWLLVDAVPRGRPPEVSTPGVKRRRRGWMR